VNPLAKKREEAPAVGVNPEGMGDLATGIGEAYMAHLRSQEAGEKELRQRQESYHRGTQLNREEIAGIVHPSFDPRSMALFKEQTSALDDEALQSDPKAAEVRTSIKTAWREILH